MTIKSRQIMTVLVVISHIIKSGVAPMLDAKKCAMKILNALGMSGLVKNQLNLGVISSMRWSTVSQSVPVNVEDHSEELVTLHGNKTEPILMTQIYESLVNEEFRRIRILLILLYKPNKILEAIAFKNFIRTERMSNLPKICFHQFALLFKLIFRTSVTEYSTINILKVLI